MADARAASHVGRFGARSGQIGFDWVRSGPVWPGLATPAWPRRALGLLGRGLARGLPGRGPSGRDITGRISGPSYTAPKRPRNGPKRFQDGLKRVEDGPKMVPRWPQKSPKWSQDGPMRSQDGSKRPQDGPKWLQDGTSPNLGSILARFGLHFRAPLASQKRPKMNLNYRTIYDAVMKPCLVPSWDQIGTHLGVIWDMC